MPAVHTQTILYHLGLIYLALAFETDEDITNEEVDVIADRLRAWQDSVGDDSVLYALSRALETFDVSKAAEDRERAVADAVAAVAAQVPEPRRRSIMDDLVAIATADGKVLAEESTFIGQLADAWALHETSRRRPWSLLLKGSPAEAWTPLHDLGLVYLALAHQSDARLEPDELQAITKKLKEWVPEATPAQTERLVRRVLARYAEGPVEPLVEQAIDRIAEAVPAHQRPAILADLMYVARADGVMLVEERHLIACLAETWGLRAD